MSETTNYDWLLTLPQLEALMASILQDYLVMQTCALTVTHQPKLELDLVPTLPTTQALAKSHVRAYQTSLAREQIYLYTQVESIAHMFQTYSPKLAKLGQAWDNQEENAAQAFKSGLTDMRHYPLTERQRTRQIYGNMHLYQQQINDDCVRYQSDQDQADEKIAGAQGDLAKLRQELSELSQKLDEVNQRIAEGASRDMLKAAEIGIQLGAAVAGVPAIGDVVISTSFSFADQAVDDGRNPLAESDALLKQYAADLVRYADEKTQMAVLATLHNNINRFAGSVTNMLNTLDAISAAFDDMVKRIDILQSYDKGETKTFFADQVARGTAFWTAMGQQATQYEQLIAHLNLEPNDVQY